MFDYLSLVDKLKVRGSGIILSLVIHIVIIWLLNEFFHFTVGVYSPLCNSIAYNDWDAKLRYFCKRIVPYEKVNWFWTFYKIKYLLVEILNTLPSILKDTCMLSYVDEVGVTGVLVMISYIWLDFTGSYLVGFLSEERSTQQPNIGHKMDDHHPSHKGVYYHEDPPEDKLKREEMENELLQKKVPELRAILLEIDSDLKTGGSKVTLVQRIMKAKKFEHTN